MTLPTLVSIKTALSAFWARLTTDLKFLWQEDRVFLIIFGALIVVAKGSSLLISFLTALSKREVNAATKQSAALQAQENADNKAADVLVNQANSLPSQEKPVTDPNWDKK